MSTQLFRISPSAHLTFVILLFFFGFTYSIKLASTSPSLVLHSFLEHTFTPHNLLFTSGFNLSLLNNFSFKPNPLVTIPLHKLVGIKDSKALLTVSSFNNSASESFIIEVQNPEKPKKQVLGETIIYSFFGVTLTNLCSISGFICIPVKRWKYFNFLLNFMIALAVSALFSTAILVLLPETMRMIDMPLEFGGQGRTYLYKLVCIPAGTLFFYLVEYVIMILPRLLRWKIQSENENASEGENANGWFERMIDVTNNSNPEISAEENGDVDPDVSICIPAMKDTIKRDRMGRFCPCFTPEKFSQIATVAWMVLIGDAFHNFMDGMTIAVGFTESPPIGIALSLSVLCEELPHELGDFAVLISSGFSIKSAIVANFLSSCSAYLGMILGLVVGEVSTGALYVFAITAGFFLYISLSNMIPSLRAELEVKEKKGENSFWLFLIQVFGLLTGFGCVLGITLISDLISF